MPGDPNECRERAIRCWALAAETQNPIIKRSLTDLAQRWAHLAAGLETTQRLLENWGEAGSKKKKAG